MKHSLEINKPHWGSSFCGGRVRAPCFASDLCCCVTRTLFTKVLSVVVKAKMSASFPDGATAVRRNIPMDPSSAPRASQRPLSDADARLKQHVYGPSSLSSAGARRTGKLGGRNEHWSGREMGIAKGEIRWIVGLTVLAVIVRCWKIWQPSSVVYVRVSRLCFLR
jgi:hypothetical protein